MKNRRVPLWEGGGSGGRKPLADTRGTPPEYEFTYSVEA